VELLWELLKDETVETVKTVLVNDETCMSLTSVNGISPQRIALVSAGTTAPPGPGEGPVEGSCEDRLHKILVDSNYNF
jgi:hypothetical protein